jgi:hypothetical protein
MSTNMNELSHDKIQAEIVKIFTEIEKMRAETTKINKETRWYEFVIMGGFIIGCLAAAKWILDVI